MSRLIVLIVLTAAVVAFGMANGHRVPVSFIVGEPVQVRQIFLLASAAVAGAVGTLVAQQLARVSRRRQRELLRAARRDVERERALGSRRDGGPARPKTERERALGARRDESAARQGRDATKARRSVRPQEDDHDQRKP